MEPPSPRSRGEHVLRPILVDWVTRVVCNMDKGTILVCEFGNASAHDSGVVEVEVELGERSHVGTMFRSGKQFT